MKHLVLLFLFPLSSCNTRGQNENFKAEWPKNDSVYRNQIIKARKERLIVLGLNDISKGVDSFELRFGYNQILFIGKGFFVIKYENGKWHGQHYYYEQKDDINNSKEDLNYSSKLTDLRDTFTIQKPFTPLVAWDKLVDNINQSGILNIPSQIDIKGYKNEWNDGTAFWLEFATKKSFKFISYENPEQYKKFKESKIVTNFLKMFFKNLKPQERCWPRCIK